MEKSKLFIASCFVLNVLSLSTNAQVTQGPYTVRNSAEFESPKKHEVSDPIAYGDKGIIQMNIKKAESFSFQLFNNNLEFQKENTVPT
ncbi:MAG: hypothetical protein ACXVPM_13175, partial [Bacteroidia bacterium]